MNTNTDTNILKFIKDHSQARPIELVHSFGFTQAAIHRQLNKLLALRLIERIGTPPKVYYQLTGDSIEEKIKKTLIKNPHIISAYILGSYLSGNTNQESDFDLAVVVRNKMTESQTYNLIKNIKFPKELDLSVVDKSSSPLFLFQIVSTGKRIFEKNTFEAIAFEDFSLHNYYDTAHLRHLNYLSLKEKFLYAN